jgi:branched-chain amino acid transport system ATP-binding protein
MLELTSVSARYGAVTVLQDVSLSLREGEVTCLLGSNGAGKTTLIRTILGIVRPVAGQIVFRGRRLDGAKTHRVIEHGIAVVPEGRRVFPRMTVAENLRMGAYRDWGSSAVTARTAEIYALFPRLGERRAQVAATMSGGEQAMLAMGRALMSRPSLLLLDEPSLGLSPLLVEQIFELVRRINAAGTTVFLVEQNARKTLAVSHRGYILQKGQIVGSGSAAELAESPVVRHAYLMAR